MAESVPASEADAAGPAEYAVQVWVRGRVQGVGFRWWTRSRALELGLTGYARNTADGRVEVRAQGDEAAVRRLVGLLREEPTSRRRPGQVSGVVVDRVDPRAGLAGFGER